MLSRASLCVSWAFLFEQVAEEEEEQQQQQQDQQRYEIKDQFLI